MFTESALKMKSHWRILAWTVSFGPGPVLFVRWTCLFVKLVCLFVFMFVKVHLYLQSCVVICLSCNNKNFADLTKTWIVSKENYTLDRKAYILCICTFSSFFTVSDGKRQKNMKMLFAGQNTQQQRLSKISILWCPFAHSNKM